MPEPLPVTVLIPAYQRAELLARALASVAAQRGAAPAEVLVVDDASTDATADVARAAGARVVVHPENRGEGAARNTGLEAAEHEWVALLDSDDEWRPEHLATLWPLHQGHVLAATACLQEGEGERRVHGWVGPRPRELRSPGDLLFPQNLLAPSATLLHRDTALAVGGFAEGMPRAADLDLWIRVLEAGRGVVSPAVTVTWHQHSGQVSQDRERMGQAQLETILRYADRPWFDARTPERYRGLLAWDARRHHGPAALLPLLGHPRRLEGLARALAWRRSVRRAGRRL